MILHHLNGQYSSIAHLINYDDVYTYLLSLHASLLTRSLIQLTPSISSTLAAWVLKQVVTAVYGNIQQYWS